MLILLTEPRVELESIGPQRWRVPVTTAPAGWAPLPVAYSPLWVARAVGGPVAIRRDDLGLVEAALPAGATAVQLEHRAGAAERAGAGLSLLSVAALAVAGLRRGRA